MRKRSLAAVLACVVMVGCGQTANVKGTVKYKGELLKGGSITAIAGNGTFADMIKEDGTYQLRGLRPGRVNFLVVSQDPKLMSEISEKLKKAKEGANPEKKDPRAPKIDLTNPKINLIPAKYADPTKELLAKDLVAGDNVYDIELKD
ncbi:MAG: hypothetical protein NZO58_06375 [Gemmataceae bacterium]|nr:hypothetical protein [Gemmataceae bacterium]